MDLLNSIVTIAFLVFLYQRSIKDADERIVLIRELSIAFKSPSIEKYLEAIPEKKVDEIEIPADELVPIEDVDPSVLLRSLEK